MGLVGEMGKPGNILTILYKKNVVMLVNSQSNFKLLLCGKG